jgi:Cu(I)/Ag(I) efflux system periplasmic protein CusF
MRGPSRLALALALSLGLGRTEAQETAAKGVFAGHGVVRAVQPETGALTLSHDDIAGFMPAMEMMYRVSSPALSQDLKPGDVVDFEIDAAKYMIVEVKLVSHAR